MKTEIIIENKAKFFAQYYGKNVFLNLNYTKEPIDLIGIRIMNNDLIDGVLLLKPLLSISNYDLATMVEEFDISIGSGFLDEYDNLQDFKNNLDINACWPIGMFDFLRSKGYALPFMGLSVDEMIKAGWIKLL